ncbi:undecaprenyldiphospho-muramoylpentapeptide beta-N-acetylglucosaminyltransferase [Aurantimonas sp. MSK8Z-1]|uniref:undecaprenyldiphospho-muramoylpentapeptide beta-N-acetylglucosaminyltransferase n=1 Tax=Mangrovibrevibacter kandeliae TaxID=2968473 RepID=UPI0021189410|nr:undecaprenyldiphospho-muramoylpentapeptide beta-N-acetylglucosaminyltransferase [Aurantimonas sp. MSK8Z-1]MCW4116681.1 undecaprenyldiphospho-muramoylpentapeptide beta-N-acetylglucosaminyltransferase [Aurantimonas sp. MSK8Z-1]
MPDTILLSAGGTGGHLFPAEALAHELNGRGFAVHLVTDARAERFAGSFPAEAVHTVPSATFGSKNPVRLASTAWTLLSGYRAARRLVKRIRPAVVVGFGGYPTLPPLMAATSLGVPSLVHEQNAVMGRANRTLAGRVQAIAGGFLRKAGPHAAKIVEVGNPVRPAVLAAADTPYTPPQADAPIRLLVFGGSQGARFFSDMIPEVIARLPVPLRARLSITQQARPEDQARVKARYDALNVAAEVEPFFRDLPARMAAAHLILSRSGASTVLELSVIGRPSILVPLPHALDDDQGHNAQLLVDAGAALMRRQPTIEAEAFAGELGALLEAPDRLAGMAAAARTLGRTNATELLADLVASMRSGHAKS